jgi:hypothetical protein
VRFDNIEIYERRIQKSFDALNKLGAPLNAEIAVRYKELKLDELRLAYEYRCRKQHEREEQRATRERLREQERAERELRDAREKMEKERMHIVVATAQYKARLTEAAGNEIRADLQEKLAAAAERLAELDAAAKQLALWDANPRAGYVYVVSNIGSFGDGVYKIGVTRRQHPEERIGELSAASVPFEFDTHAMIFALDAYELEAKLHAHFEHHRVNKVNGWKEFFRADIREIEAVIRENYDRGFDLVREAVAEEYRESLRL